MNGSCHDFEKKKEALRASGYTMGPWGGHLTFHAMLIWNEEEVRRMALAMAIGLLVWEGKLRIESLFQP